MKNTTLLFATLLLLVTTACTEDSVNDIAEECSQGYTGYDCNEQITPSLITITKVVVQSFSSTFSDGLSSYPDIALKVYNNSNTYGPSATYYYDAYSWSSYNFYPNFKIYNAFENTHVVLYDYDFLFGEIVDEDYMGGVQGTLYNSYNGFPSMVNFDYGSYEFDVHLSYQW